MARVEAETKIWKQNRLLWQKANLSHFTAGLPPVEFFCRVFSLGRGLVVRIQAPNAALYHPNNNKTRGALANKNTNGATLTPVIQQ